jgi:hypothetical protein
LPVGLGCGVILALLQLGVTQAYMGLHLARIQAENLLKTSSSFGELSLAEKAAAEVEPFSDSRHSIDFTQFVRRNKLDRRYYETDSCVKHHHLFKFSSETGI